MANGLNPKTPLKEEGDIMNNKKTAGVTLIAPEYCCKEPLTIEEVVKYTGLSRGSIYQLIHNKQVPCYKPFGKKIYFKRTELDSFLFRKKLSADYEVSDMADAILNGEESGGEL
jgi:excisionase family DNA binding protein